MSVAKRQVFAASQKLARGILISNRVYFRQSRTLGFKLAKQVFGRPNLRAT